MDGGKRTNIGRRSRRECRFYEELPDRGRGFDICSTSCSCTYYQPVASGESRAVPDKNSNRPQFRERGGGGLRETCVQESDETGAIDDRLRLERGDTQIGPSGQVRPGPISTNPVPTCVPVAVAEPTEGREAVDRAKALQPIAVTPSLANMLIARPAQTGWPAIKRTRGIQEGIWLLVDDTMAPPPINTPPPLAVALAWLCTERKSRSSRRRSW